MNNVSSVVISRKDFKTDDELYAKVGQQVRLLLESGYVLVAEDVEEKGGTIVIQFMPSANAEPNTPKPFWLVPNEMLAAMDVHVSNEVKRANAIIEASKMADSFADDTSNKKYDA